MHNWYKIAQEQMLSFYPEVEEREIRNTLAWTIGLRNYEAPSDFESEGVYDSTIIFYGVIPPKYLHKLNQ